MSGHNKSSDIQRKVEYFQELKNKAFVQKQPRLTPRPQASAYLRRPGQRGK